MKTIVLAGKGHGCSYLGYLNSLNFDQRSKHIDFCCCYTSFLKLFFMGCNMREDVIILDLNQEPFDQPHVSEAKLAKAKLVELGALIR